MIQVNLLPDIKLQYLKAKRTQRAVVVISILVVAITAAIFMVLFLTVNVWQKHRIERISQQITEVSQEIKDTPELDRILTVQSQLIALPGLHDSKPAVKRTFGYLNSVTPDEVSISKVKVDYASSTMTIEGSAASLHSVNKFVDTLKFTKYKTNNDSETESLNAFGNVVMKTFGRDTKGANYTIELNFDPTIFSNTERKLTVTVPKDFITTRSVTQRPNLDGLIEPTDPNPLFEERGEPIEEGEER